MKAARRFLLLILSFVMIFCFVSQTGCSENNRKNADIIQFWHTYTGKQCNFFEMLVDTYNATEGKRRNVYIEAQYKTESEIQRNLEKILDSKVSGSEYPEITVVSSEMAYKAKMHNLVTKAEDYIPKEELSKYFAGFMQEGQITGTGETYVFPISKTSSITVINDSLWRQFYNSENINILQWKTWNGITSLAEKYYAWTEGKALMAFESVEEYIFAFSAQMMPPLIQTGNKEIKINTNKEMLRAMWDFYYGGVVNGYILQTDNIVDSLEKGDIAAYVGTPHDPTYYPQRYTNHKGENDTFLITSSTYPTVSETRKTYVHKGNGVCVFDHGERINQESYDFLHWFSTNENVIQFSIANNEISSYKPIYDKSSTASYLKQISIINNNKHYMFSNSLSQVAEGTTYAPTGFVGYDSFCDEITQSLVQSSARGLQKVLELEAGGKTRKQAVSEVFTNEEFELWYNAVLEITNKY